MNRKQITSLLAVAGFAAGATLIFRSPESTSAIKNYVSNPTTRGIRDSFTILPSEDIDAIRALIKSGRVTGQELASLVRLYGDQYVVHRSRHQILEDIKATLRSATDREVGNAAMLTYSRLGPADEVRSLLKLSKERGFLTDDDYFGEIAHSLFRADPRTQAAWLDELVEGKNMYARQILADFVSRDAAIDSANASTVRQLLDYFKSSETKFSENPVEYGLFAGLDYEKWLTASARLNAMAYGISSEQFINQTLLDSELDPRKALSWFLAEGKVESFVNNANPEERRALADRLIIFSTRNGTEFVFDSVQSLYPRLALSKGTKKP